MKGFLLVTVLLILLQYQGVLAEVEDNSLTGEIVNLLNGTFSLNEKICSLQRQVDGIEHRPDFCACNTSDISGFKRAISDEVNVFSKILSGFENEIRTLKRDQVELMALLDRKHTEAVTTPEPQGCENDWIQLQDKCYYVSETYERIDFETSRNKCKAMGAKLAEIKNDDQAAMLKTVMPDRVREKHFLYTGRWRDSTLGWVYPSNNERVDLSVRSWRSGEPDGGTQRCGCVSTLSDFLMLDCFCNGYGFYYICEVAL